MNAHISPGPKKSLSIVVAVYNAVRYLEFVLTGLRRQSFNDFEIIIADDGSSPEIKELIDRMQPSLPVTVSHLWQPDQGFRKNAMLNRAIEHSQTDYIVFIDGDCVPHKHFVLDHWSHRQTRTVLCGRRVNLGKAITERLSLSDIQMGTYETLNLRLLFDGLMARSSNLEDAIRIQNETLRRLLHRNRARILGCNFSVEKRFLELVNGFNEDYQAPGLGEDSDIAHRMELSGIRPITLRYLAVLFHLYHPFTQTGENNTIIYEKMIAAKNPVCRHGLHNLNEAEPAAKIS